MYQKRIRANPITKVSSFYLKEPKINKSLFRKVTITNFTKWPQTSSPHCNFMGRLFPGRFISMRPHILYLIRVHTVKLVCLLNINRAGGPRGESSWPPVRTRIRFAIFEEIKRDTPLEYFIAPFLELRKDVRTLNGELIGRLLFETVNVTERFISRGRHGKNK